MLIQAGDTAPLNSATQYKGVGRNHHAPAALLPEKDPLYPLKRRLFGGPTFGQLFVNQKESLVPAWI